MTSLFTLHSHCKEPYFFQILPHIDLSKVHKPSENDKRNFLYALAKHPTHFSEEEAQHIFDFVTNHKLLNKIEHKNNFQKLGREKFPHQVWERLGIIEPKYENLQAHSSIWFDLDKETFFKQCKLHISSSVNEYNHFITDCLSAIKKQGLANSTHLDPFVISRADAKIMIKTEQAQKVQEALNYLIKSSHEKDLSLIQIGKESRAEYMTQLLKAYFMQQALDESLPHKDNMTIKRHKI